MLKRPKPATSGQNSKKTKVVGNTGKKRFVSRLKARRQKPEGAPRRLTGSFRLFADSVSLMRQHWRLFGGIILVYLVLSLTLVGVLGNGSDVAELKRTFVEERGQLSASLSLFGVLLGATNTATSERGAAYQTMVLVLVSLATIWSLRQVLAGKKVSVRDAFYKGMYPVIPFVLVVLFLGLLFVPALVGSFILSVVFGTGLAASLLEKALWGVAVFALVALSLHWLTTFVFSVYIVTLPDSRPFAAIRAARKISMYNRWTLLRRLLFLPLALVLIGAAVTLPLIMVVPGFVQWAFVLLSMVSLIFIHTYLYNLYKELL